MTLGPVGVDGDRLPAGFDSTLKILAALDIGSVSAKPVLGAREFPRRVEVAFVSRDRGAPEIGRAARAGQVGAIRVQAIGLAPRVAGGWGGRLSRQSRDIE
jgi:hypothetical protein